MLVSEAGPELMRVLVCVQNWGENCLLLHGCTGLLGLCCAFVLGLFNTVWGRYWICLYLIHAEIRYEVAVGFWRCLKFLCDLEITFHSTVFWWSWSLRRKVLEAAFVCLWRNSTSVELTYTNISIADLFCFDISSIFFCWFVCNDRNTSL